MTRRRPFRALVVAALAVAWSVAAAAFAGPAQAHAELVSSQPQAGEHLEAPPEQAVLRFSESVTPVTGGIRLLDADGEELPVGSVRASGTEVAVPLPAELDDGGYLLVWRVVSSDSHPVSGTVQFAVGEDAEPPRALARRRRGRPGRSGRLPAVRAAVGGVSPAWCCSPARSASCGCAGPRAPWTRRRGG